VLQEYQAPARHRLSLTPHKCEDPQPVELLAAAGLPFRARRSLILVRSTLCSVSLVRPRVARTGVHWNGARPFPAARRFFAPGRSIRGALARQPARNRLPWKRASASAKRKAGV